MRTFTRLLHLFVTSQTRNTSRKYRGVLGVELLEAWEVPAITVTTLDDSADITYNHLSLRTAIGLANQGQGPTDIEFAGFLYANGIQGVIYLSSPLPAFSNSIAVIGPGRGSMIIVGGGQGSIFKAQGSQSGISGLTVVNGNTTGSGGAVLVTSIFSASSCLFQGNIATNNGGAIAAESRSVLSVTDCIFSTNSTANGIGGAIYAGDNATVSVSSCTFQGNSSTKGGAVAANLQ